MLNIKESRLNKPLSKEEDIELLSILRDLSSSENITLKPHTREGCKNIIRPCPFVSCVYNTYLDVYEDGTIKINNKDNLDPTQVNPRTSCTLDIVDRNPNGLSNSDIGEIIGKSRETVRLTIMNVLSKTKVEFDREDVDRSVVTTNNLSTESILDMQKDNCDVDAYDLLTASALKGSVNKLDCSIILANASGKVREQIASDLGVSEIFVEETLDEYGYYGYLLPGEVELADVADEFSMSPRLLQNWIKQGLEVRDLDDNIVTSVAKVRDFLRKNARILYLLRDKPTRYKIEELEKEVDYAVS